MSTNIPVKVCSTSCPPKIITQIVQTGGNNPQISNKMRIATLLKIGKQGRVDFANNNLNEFGSWAGGPSGGGSSIKN